MGYLSEGGAIGSQNQFGHLHRQPTKRLRNSLMLPVHPVPPLRRTASRDCRYHRFRAHRQDPRSRPGARATTAAATTRFVRYNLSRSVCRTLISPRQHYRRRLPVRGFPFHPYTRMQPPHQACDLRNIPIDFCHLDKHGPLRRLLPYGWQRRKRPVFFPIRQRRAQRHAMGNSGQGARGDGTRTDERRSDEEARAPMVGRAFHARMLCGFRARVQADRVARHCGHARNPPGPARCWSCFVSDIAELAPDAGASMTPPDSTLSRGIPPQA